MDTPALDSDQLERYSRQLVLEELGPAGQHALQAGSVLVVGAGGLGAPVLAYLGAAGVGHIGVIDHDTVERSNLQRQIIHTTADIGTPKVDSARSFLKAQNPNVTVSTYEQTLTADVAVDLLSEYDVIVDGTDSFQTRYLINDVAVLTETPLVHGAVDRLTGQVLTIDGGKPCYRCLRPVAPPPGTVPDCATAGVLGVVPGTIGTIQATETINLLTETEPGLSGAVFHYDAATITAERVSLEPDPDCPICAEELSPETIQEFEYEGRCRING